MVRMVRAVRFAGEGAAELDALLTASLLVVAHLQVAACPAMLPRRLTC